MANARNTSATVRGYRVNSDSGIRDGGRSEAEREVPREVQQAETQKAYERWLEARNKRIASGSVRRIR